MSWNGSDQVSQPAREDTRKTGASRRAAASDARSPRGRDCPNRVAKGHNPSIVHLFSTPIFYLILLVVALGGAAVWWFYGGRGATRPTAAPTVRHNPQIAEVKPAAAHTNATAAVAPVDPKEAYDHSQFYRDEKGILRYMSGCRAPDPTRKPGKVVNLSARSKPSVFSNSAERAIYQLIRRKPGNRVMGVKRDWYDKGLEEEFQKSLLDPIRVNETDTPRERRAKEAMIEAKAEIVERIKQGESLGDILTSAEKETRRLRDYRKNLEDQVGDIVEKGEGKLSTSDVKDLVKAANEMFEKEGLKPIKEDAFVKWNLQLSGSDPEGGEASEKPNNPKGEKKDE